MAESTTDAQRAIAALTRLNATVAIAESVTGGLLAARLTDVPGASAVVAGGVVAYATHAKSSVLGVSESTLAEQGAVSAQTALEMAVAVQRIFSARIGIATTGVAGPERQEGHDVGTVFIALADAETTQVTQLALNGSRQQIRDRTVDYALNLLGGLA